MTNFLKTKQFKTKNQPLVLLVSWLVGLYGFYDIVSTLYDQFVLRHLDIISKYLIDTRILLGIGLIYLSILLARRKRNALIVSLIIVAFMFGAGFAQFIRQSHHLAHINVLLLMRLIIAPLAALLVLIFTRSEFKVKSDQIAFRNSIKLAVIVLIVTLFYGILGFMLMDKTDFHQEIGFTSALHHTIDQFGLTTNSPLVPHTRRARLFVDSLSFISFTSIVYVIVSLFMPVRTLLIDQASGRERMKRLMDEYGAPSEDFFKLWPHDKHYFFDSGNTAGLAYHVRHGVALILADPVGDKAAYSRLIREFSEMCWSNDWQPALVHIEARFADFYRDNGFQMQLIGQEAVVSLSKFVSETANNKYFRNIRNRFNRENFSVEVLDPPHHQAVVDRLRDISMQWLDKPGRTERGFVMGYYSDEYVQQCRVVVVRDAAKTIQSFMNLVPSTSFAQHELTYDMLRNTKDAPPNINDFMLYELLHKLKDEGYTKFNLGLCPLVGLDEADEDSRLIGRVLRFAYINGDRIYSFSGLHRFKDKYEPVWSDRFVAYKGGVTGFSRTLNALLAAMKVKTRLLQADTKRRSH